MHLKHSPYLGAPQRNAQILPLKKKKEADISFLHSKVIIAEAATATFLRSEPT